MFIFLLTLVLWMFVLFDLTSLGLVCCFFQYFAEAFVARMSTACARTVRLPHLKLQAYVRRPEKAQRAHVCLLGQPVHQHVLAAEEAQVWLQP